MTSSTLACLTLLYTAFIEPAAFYYGLGILLILIQGLTALLHSFRLDVDLKFKQLADDRKEDAEGS